MKSTKESFDEAVKHTLDPLERRKLITRLERNLPLLRFSTIGLCIVVVFVGFGSLFGGTDIEHVALLIGIMALNGSIYAMQSQRLIQLRVEEERFQQESSSEPPASVRTGR